MKCNILAELRLGLNMAFGVAVLRLTMPVM